MPVRNVRHVHYGVSQGVSDLRVMETNRSPDGAYMRTVRDGAPPLNVRAFIPVVGGNEVPDPRGGGVPTTEVPLDIEDDDGVFSGVLAAGCLAVHDATSHGIGAAGSSGVAVFVSVSPCF